VSKVRRIKLNGQWVTLPAGVEIRNDRIRIGFSYAGRYCYETLPGQPDAERIRKAGIKRAAVMLEIEEGRFDYLHHFPTSSKALRLAGVSNSNTLTTIGQLLDEEAGIAEETKAPATVKAELPRHRYIRDYFGARRPVRDITAEDIERFKRHLLKQVTAKTANNVLIPLRSILKRAYARSILTKSLHDRFEGYRGKAIRPSKDVLPLTLAELDQFAAVKVRPVDRDMFLFNCWTGLSISELIALAWEDVDTNAPVWTLNIRRARVDNQWKCPKVESRERIIELNSKAQALLAAQRARTQLQATIQVQVLQRTTLVSVQEKIRPVFRNSISGHPWNPKSLDRCFRYLCRKAKITERGPNQCRHTFASRMLTAGLPVQMLVQLMGHSSETMIRRHYAKWLAGEVQGRVAGLMDQVIGSLE